MCVSTPKVVQPKVEAPVNTEDFNASDDALVSRESEIQRRRKALSRLQTMQGNSIQGNDGITGKQKLGA